MEVRAERIDVTYGLFEFPSIEKLHKKDKVEEQQKQRMHAGCCVGLRKLFVYRAKLNPEK